MIPSRHSTRWPHRSRKPLHGTVEIDWTHPLSHGLLACWLCCERAGVRLHDLAFGNHATSTDPTTVWTGLGGIEQFKFNNVSAVINAPSAALQTLENGPFSFVVKVTPGVTVTNYGGTIQIQNNVLSYENTRWAFVVADNLRYTGSVVVLDVPIHVIATRSGTTYAMYENGRLVSNAGGSDSGYGLAGKYNLAYGYGAGRFEGAMACALIYGRALTAAEVLQLYADPYCFLRPVSRPHRFVLSIPAPPPAVQHFWSYW